MDDKDTVILTDEQQEQIDKAFEAADKIFSEINSSEPDILTQMSTKHNIEAIEEHIAFKENISKIPEIADNTKKLEKVIQLHEASLEQHSTELNQHNNQIFLATSTLDELKKQTTENQKSSNSATVIGIISLILSVIAIVISLKK